MAAMLAATPWALRAIRVPWSTALSPYSPAGMIALVQGTVIHMHVRRRDCWLCRLAGKSLADHTGMNTVPRAEQRSACYDRSGRMPQRALQSRAPSYPPFLGAASIAIDAQAVLCNGSARRVPSRSRHHRAPARSRLLRAQIAKRAAPTTLPPHIAPCISAVHAPCNDKHSTRECVLPAAGMEICVGRADVRAHATH